MPGAIESMMAEMHGPEEEAEEAGGGMQACAEDLMAAIESKDAAGIAAALQSAFDMMETKPHEEASHEE